MKNLKTFAEFVNEAAQSHIGKYKHIGTYATLDGDDILAQTYKNFESSDDEDLDLKVMKKGYESIAKLVGGNMNTVSATMEEGDFEFCRALNQFLPERVASNDPNIEKVGEVTINSPFTSAKDPAYVSCYLIKDVNIKVATWFYGDDFAVFDHVAYLTKDAKALLTWVNANLF